MKKINHLIWSVAVVLMAMSLMSCKEKAVTSDGIEYTYVKKGSEKPKNGDFILYHLIVMTEKDSTFLSTYDQRTPGYIMYNDSLPRESGMDEIFLGLRKGDSIAFEAKAAKVFGESNIPFFLEQNSSVKIRIGVIDVTDQQGAEAYFERLQEAEMQRQSELAKKQIEIDAQIIEEYLTDNNLEAKKTESGLYYIIEKEGKGVKIEQGDLAFVHYAGYLLDGTIFDTSWKDLAQAGNVYSEERDNVGGYSPLEVFVGQGRVIQGWDEGLSLLSKGDKAKFIIPSSLAYGERGAGAKIQPNSILIFDVEITDVQK